MPWFAVHPFCTAGRAYVWFGCGPAYISLIPVTGSTTLTATITTRYQRQPAQVVISLRYDVLSALSHPGLDRPAAHDHCHSSACQAEQDTYKQSRYMYACIRAPCGLPRVFLTPLASVSPAADALSSACRTKAAAHDRRSCKVLAAKFEPQVRHGGVVGKPNQKYGVVVGRFNDLVTKLLLEGAYSAFASHGVSSDEVEVGLWDTMLWGCKMPSR